MIFSKALMLKVLGGMAVCTGVTIGGVKLLGGSGKGQENPNPGNQNTQDGSQRADGGTNEGTQEGGNPQPQQNPPGNQVNTNSGSDPNSQVSQTNTEETPEKLIEKAGLNCGDGNSGECTGIIEQKTINVKQGETTFEMTTLTGSGKIKFQKNVTEGNYNKGLKLVIEDGNITKDSHTLEQYETYEIEKGGEGDDKYYLTRKTTSFEEKMKLLGIPSTKCNVVEESVDKSCDLTGEDLNSINFKDKVGNPTLSSAKTTTLTIVKSSEDGFADGGYKFILKTDGTLNIVGASSTAYTIYPNTNTEFKINKAEANKWTLERAWDASKLAEKVELESCTTPPNTSDNECTFKTNTTINVKNKDLDIKGATISEAGKKIKFVTNQPNYNQGIKFYSQGDISLGDNGKKIEGMGFGADYEIKKLEGEWYLSQVNPSNKPNSQ